MKDKALTKEKALDLKTVIEMGRLDESLRSQIKLIPTTTLSADINHVNQHHSNKYSAKTAIAILQHEKRVHTNR